MVSILNSSAIDRGFDPRLGKTKDYKIGICGFFVKHVSLICMSKDWNHVNVSVWGEMSTRRLLFQWARAIKMCIGLVQSWHNHHLIELQLSCLLGVHQQSLTHSLTHKYWVFTALWLKCRYNFFLNNYKINNMKNKFDSHWYFSFDWLICLCLTPLSAIFQLYHGDF